MRKSWLKYFGFSQDEPKEQPKEFVAQLPGNKKYGGRFDPMSSTWAFIEAWAEEKLDKLRRNNDNSINMDKTSSLRGQIKGLKALLNLPEEVKNEQKKLNNN